MLSYFCNAQCEGITHQKDGVTKFRQAYTDRLRFDQFLIHNNQSFGQCVDTVFWSCNISEPTFYTHITTLMISNTHLGHEFWQKNKRTNGVEVCCNITHFIT
jgi:hypothetical protein